MGMRLRKAWRIDPLGIHADKGGGPVDMTPAAPDILEFVSTLLLFILIGAAFCYLLGFCVRLAFIELRAACSAVRLRRLGGKTKRW
jgi:hypothetical protein